MTTFHPHELEWTAESVRRLWDYYGSNPAYAEQYFSRHSGAEILAVVDREIGLRRKRVLDFGSGRGDLLVHLAERGVQAAGLEFSEESATLAERRLAGHPAFGGITVTADLPSPLPRGAFDVVFLVEVVEHLLDSQLGPTIEEVGRVLAPGGHVVATSPNAEDLAASFVRCPECGATFHRWQHLRSLSPHGIAELFEAHGFETKVARGVFWGATWKTRLRLRLRGKRLPEPHLVYVGAMPDGGR